MFVMEYWKDGNAVRIGDLKNTSYDLYLHAKEMRANELREIRGEGFRPNDELSLGNSLYSIEDDEICLLDFEDWSYGGSNGK